MQKQTNEPASFMLNSNILEEMLAAQPAIRPVSNADRERAERETARALQAEQELADAQAEMAKLKAEMAEMRAQLAAAVAPKPEPQPESKPEPKVGIRVGSFVFYTSKRGTRKRYKVVRLGRNGSVQLEMLGHFRGDALKGKRFWAKGASVSPDAEADNGSRYCTVCGERGCNIGPFAVG